MKNKELKTKLSKLQSRAYNLQTDLSRLIAELDRDENKIDKLIEDNKKLREMF